MAEDDKSDLRQLSQCLNQASSLIEAILKHPEHCSSSSQSTSTETYASDTTINTKRHPTFIDIPKDTNEKVIRGKLGEAIRMKFPMVTDTDFEFVQACRRRITKPVSVGEYNFSQIKLLAGQGCIENVAGRKCA